MGPARRSNPLWEDDHEVLAALLLRAWDLPAATTEYGKLAAVRWRTDCLVYAGACHQLMGDSAGAESLYSLVARRMRYPVKAVGLGRHPRRLAVSGLSPRTIAPPWPSGALRPASRPPCTGPQYG